MDRFLLYERLSRATESSTSIQRQDESCRSEVVRRNGVIVADPFVDEGVSGALPPLDRPAMKQLLHSLGGVDAVMVWKIDRIARSFVGFADIVRELDKHGVALISATEPIDMTGPTGRAMAQMIATFAELEREMIKARVRDSMRKAKEDKRFHGGRVPYGLTPAPHPSGKGRVLVRDEHAVSVLRELLLWILEGARLTECARRLNARGEPTSRQRGATLKGVDKAQDAQWRTRALRFILTSPTMLGHRPLPGGGVELDDDGLEVVTWTPVFSSDEWDALQSELEAQAQIRKSPAASHWLSGVLRCTECEGNLKQHTASNGLRSFTCSGSETQKHKPGVYVGMEKVIEWVMEEFPRRFAVLPEVHRVWVPGTDATRELTQVTRAIARLRDDRDAGLFDDEEDEYRDRVKRLNARKRALEDVPQVTPHWEVQSTGRTLGEAWAALDVDDKRGDLLREYGLHVWVRPAPSRTTPVDERADFGPADPEADAMDDALHQAML
jgi:DNA invertase Pin-like site-specific DNA recombinase